MSWILKLMMAALAITTVAVVVDGVKSGAVASGILYVALAAACVGEWAYIRRESDEAKSAADRMLIGTFTLLIWIARLTFG